MDRGTWRATVHAVAERLKDFHYSLYRFIKSKNVPHLGDVEEWGRQYRSGDKGVYRKSMYLPLNFAVNLKLF